LRRDAFGEQQFQVTDDRSANGIRTPRSWSRTSPARPSWSARTKRTRRWR